MHGNIRTQSVTTRESPEAIAKHAIAVLEKRLWDKHGQYLRYGCELEWSFLPKPGRRTTLCRPILMDIKDKVHDDLTEDQIFVPAKRRVHKKQVRYLPAHENDWVVGVREPLFPDSPYVSYSYQEDARKHETIISHEGTHDRLSAGRRGLTFARAIEALQHTLTTTETRRPPLSKDEWMEATLRNLESDWRIIMPAKSSKAQGNVTHGMHINISVHSKSNSTTPDEEPWQRHYTDGLAKAYNEGLWLLNGSKSALRRTQEREEHSHQIYDGIHVRAGDYTEIKLPPADGNPYYATLLALVGILHAHAIEQSEAGGKYFAIPRLDRNTYQEDTFKLGPRNIQKRFMHGERVIINTLNESEPGLGDRFARALTHTPPGHEHSPAHALSRAR